MKRGDLIRRFDVNFWRLTPLFEDRFDDPIYPATSLGTVVQLVQYGCSSLATDKPIGTPMLRMNNLQDDGWDLRDLKYIVLRPDDVDRYRLVAGDLLFNRTNSKELVGKCAVFSEPGDWVFASYLIRVRIRAEAASPQFVSDFLSTDAGRLQIDRLSRQIIGMTNINAEELKEILLPLPPLQKQCELVSAMNNARMAREARLAEADALLAGLDGFLVETLGLAPKPKDDRKVFGVRRAAVPSRFDPHFHLPAFAQNTAMLSAYDSKHLGSLVGFSREIWHPDRQDKLTFRYIEISDVNTSTGEARAGEVPISKAPSRARMVVKEGDIIVSLTRPHHGAIAQITPDLDGCIASTGFAVLRSVDESRITREYLWCILRSQMCLKQMLQRASGGNYPAITEAELSNVLIPVPDPAVQDEVASEAANRKLTARRLRSQADAEWQVAKRWFEAQLLRASS